MFERVEELLARVAVMYATVHCAPGKTPPTLNDLLPHRKAWPDRLDTRYSDVDQEVLAALL